jgi:hypothetical protein
VCVCVHTCVCVCVCVCLCVCVCVCVCVWVRSLGVCARAGRGGVGAMATSRFGSDDLLLY